MSFKVGDRVRRVADPLGPAAPLGYETEVVEPLNQHYIWYINAHGERVDGYPENWELVQPASPSPVRTKTVKEIVPGEYGPVSLRRYDRDGADHIRVSLFYSDEMYRALDASELREAARIFIELADALEE